ncbi:MAG: hypothetical protein M3Z28_13195, partial [Candidatus Dormibacteraeota bacterium]|nr:hypothetical protein [Candidatus Dormibacteraeota bacterium]
HLDERRRGSLILRKQRLGSGFPTKAAALEAMNRLQAAVVDVTHVERSRRTLGACLEDWLAARNDIRANTTRDYSVSIHNHIGSRLGTYRFRRSTGSASAASIGSSQRAGSSRRQRTTSTSAFAKRCKMLLKMACCVAIPPRFEFVQHPADFCPGDARDVVRERIARVFFRPSHTQM